jgi:hypothetical protein
MRKARDGVVDQPLNRVVESKGNHLQARSAPARNPAFHNQVSKGWDAGFGSKRSAGCGGRSGRRPRVKRLKVSRWR